MSRAGIKQIILCDLGTLASAPANAVALGLRNNCTMEITPYKTIKDYRGRELPNMDNIKIEAESLQPSMRMLKKLIDFTNHNCDLQVTSVKQNSSAASDDVYRFAGENSPGVDFELIYSGDKRSIKVTLERAFPKELFDSLMGVFETQSVISISGLPNEEGVDFARYRMPYTLAIESPVSTRICSDADFESRKLSIKTKGKKSAFNSSFIDYLTIGVELVTRDSSIAKLITQRNKGISPAFLWKESNGGIYYDSFEIAAGILAQKSELKNSDEERTLKITYGADIPLYDLSFEFGTGKGGDESDTEGIKGGTVKIG
jgi:hypothetical protein